ncbi:GNAT family N-acetyltransferase [Alloalcanivorax gelatiniphagus]|uniref:N-acetyltransferase n=1 Tax=Alloalcanivorax gelatiniphagus TaxID=1194167 RepID=A0ABY2XLH2_9GAMM|nr:GNAT family N-acetyltransferase [Alloalcanivorax gelatiniphagus]TMW13039.1 N-acetyltransferase [Alloalcanivorax gelatiniphagus]
MLTGTFDLPGGLTLRPARSSDTVFLRELYAATRVDLSLLPDAELAASLIDLQFNAQTESYGRDFPDAMHFIIGLHRDRIGRLILDFSAGRVHVVDLSLIAAARGQGHGASVLRAMQRTAERVAAPVMLAVDRGNPGARNLYARLGFHSEGARGDFHEALVWWPPALCEPGREASA